MRVRAQKAVLLLFLITGCVPPTTFSELIITPEPSFMTLTPFTSDGLLYPSPSPFITPTDPGIQSTPVPQTIWFSPAVPAALAAVVLSTGMTFTYDPAIAAGHLDVQDLADPTPPASIWFYALVAPFPTVPDGVTVDELRRSWAGERLGPFFGRPLWMEQTTMEAISALWGPPAPGAVQVAPAQALTDSAWADWPSWGIVPFEALQPHWKVLTIDGQSPINKQFDPLSYPLAVPFKLEPAMINLPASNRDPEKMTVLVMIGVTAMVRATAVRMGKKGLTYPGQDIAEWLRSADITHINNEVSFIVGCPPPQSDSTSLLFCSDPSYITLLQDVGADVIELTGNHLNDWGSSSFRDTLLLYEQIDMLTYGGGYNLDDARQPLLIEHNGNFLAFIGCNLPGPAGCWATDTRPGSSPCGDKTWMVAEISRLRTQGYLPVVTFQYYEYYSYYPTGDQVNDFRSMADAGAWIVSGSQSHFPMTMEFQGDAFIHYGLGNLFFDQMNYYLMNDTLTTGTRREFIDRYIIYENRVISVELLTAMLEDYSRPRPMTSQERAQFLEDLFSASGWR